MHWPHQIRARNHPDISIHILDLRTLLPLDHDAIKEAVTATGKVLRSWNVGVAPLEVILTGHKIYVSNWGGRRPVAGSVIGPAGQGTRVRVDARSIANEGSVSVIDLAQGDVAAGILPAVEPGFQPGGKNRDRNRTSSAF